MLPIYSSSGGPKKRSFVSTQPRTWRRRALGVLALVLCAFVWMQYTILTTSMGSLPTQISHLQGGTTQRDDFIANNNPDTQGDNKYMLSKKLPHIRVPVVEDADTAKQSDIDEAIITTTTTTTITAATNSISEAIQEERRLAVRKAMKFAWGNYEEHAFGGDEVDPKDGTRIQNVWGDIACSLVDALDTLWIMDLNDEFSRARDYVANELHFDHLGQDGRSVSVFETIIREVGGLLSAYDLSQDKAFLDKAKELVDMLLPAYEESEGVFYTQFNPYTLQKSFASWSQFRAHIADVGTLQLEMRYLSDVTGDGKYATMGDAFYKIVEREGSFQHTGLFPVHFDSSTGKFSTKSTTITLGALGDSFYEYLLKVYIYSGKRTEDAYLRRLYDDAVRGLEEHLLYYSQSDDLYFLQELRVPSLAGIKRMDHLLCFVPGLLALGTLAEKDDHAKNAKHLDLAKKLMETCYQMYQRQPTKLSPDIVSFPNMKVSDGKYRLRPETIESLFYLYRVTKDDKYRQQGWEIFQAIEMYAKTKHGYGAVMDVREIPPRTENKMESFFLAETLKYHYLLQAPESLIPLDEYVFNTEAHPIRIRR